jgi:hypothetical protein
MNAVEIEEAVSALAGAPFDRVEFPYAFLAAFGNKDTTIKRLRAGSSNASDVPGGVLQRNNIHIATCAPGEVGATFRRLRASPKTGAVKAKFVLATDGDELQAEDLGSGDTIACTYREFANHFGFFLPLAGISTVRQIANNPIDIKATGRLNKLYVELLKDNEDWGTEARRHELNQFMARLIFCFFAESTGIFLNRLFTETIRQMSDSQSGNTHEVIAELFRAMNTKREDIKTAKLRPWAEQFPYVNGGLFSGPAASPRFSRIARTYLLRAGELDWKEINPDIFGSMIQAVADDDERGSLGLHYTSVPNILKVLNPLFLDDLRVSLEAAETSVRKLKNLRRRIAAIRVFDPACGSGNFLVIAYKEMREIEAVIIKRLDDDPRSWIKLDNFFGIDIKDFAVEIARLSLLIAEFQCDERLIGQREARLNVLPLHRTGQVHVGNALRMDWLQICPPSRPTMVEHDLAGPTGRLALEDNALGDTQEPETYICGNPPYRGSTWQTDEQKSDLQSIFGRRTKSWKSLDYVAGWLIKAADYGVAVAAASAFVSTNSVCQGQQVPILWPLIFATGRQIVFAYTSFKWANLASHNAGVTVAIVGLSAAKPRIRQIFAENDKGEVTARNVVNINAYLAPGADIIVERAPAPLSQIPKMIFGNKVVDGGHLRMSRHEVNDLELTSDVDKLIIRRILGSADFIRGEERYCLWIEDENLSLALSYPKIAARVQRTKEARLSSPDESANLMAARAHQFREMRCPRKYSIVLPRITSEAREYLPAGIAGKDAVLSSQNFALYDEPIWVFSVLVSKLHISWIASVCGRLEMRFMYSNTLCWNTFPVPTLTEKNKADLTRCAEDILLAREAHFPKTIGDLYDPDEMPDDLLRAHERNDETLERIYIGRRFKNDTERLEKLFELYTKMTEGKGAGAKASKKGKAKS